MLSAEWPKASIGKRRKREERKKERKEKKKNEKRKKKRRKRERKRKKGKKRVGEAIRNQKKKKHVGVSSDSVYFKFLDFSWNLSV